MCNNRATALFSLSCMQSDGDLENQGWTGVDRNNTVEPGVSLSSVLTISENSNVI
jgi:hypothetical protein